MRTDADNASDKRAIRQVDGSDIRGVGKGRADGHADT